MRLKNVKGAADKVETSGFVIHDATEHKGNWNNIFGNDKPLHVEIGMGKGRFITTLAKQNPDVNYLGIERYSSVLVRAIEKREAEEEPVSNLFFLCEDAENITDMFGEDEVGRIYLNFSDPWPKARHAKRRLTSKEYLVKYDRILDRDGRIVFKTDNRDLFDFSVEEMQENGWTLETVTYDLHKSELAPTNVMTEYEEKFSALGNKICCLIAKR
ncbi:MAG: tRNA (guanosine(46)-N7)-methyltransferase TrmB [Lachnospiraceae bacterium]|nr:tRNA (guanosine(46)-N7)-methyltransferase TrmB [Lachnospiraceae bacterium]